MKVYFMVGESLYEAYVFNEENIRRFKENKYGELYEACKSREIPYCLSIDKLSKEDIALIPKFEAEVNHERHITPDSSSSSNNIVSKEKIAGVVSESYNRCVMELQDVYNFISDTKFINNAMNRCKYVLSMYAFERAKSSGNPKNVYPEMVALSAMVSAMIIVENANAVADYDNIVAELLNRWDSKYLWHIGVLQLRTALLRVLRLGLDSEFMADVALLLRNDDYRRALYLFVHGLEGVDETRYFYIARTFGVSRTQPKYMYEKAIRKVQQIKRWELIKNDTKVIK